MDRASVGEAGASKGRGAGVKEIEMKRERFGVSGSGISALVVAAVMVAAFDTTLFFMKTAEGRGLQSGQASGTSASDSQSAALQHDGSHDFDFLIGDWHAHVRRLPDRLVHSNNWVEYNGISNHHKIFDTNANLEEFNVTSTDKKLQIKAQTLRMYNPETHQWSIYGLELDKGNLETPPLVGQFYGDQGEFYNQQLWKGRVVEVRYIWRPAGANGAHMDQAFSPDGGKTWEVNWTCDLTK
jgi:hypothetical protein